MILFFIGFIVLLLMAIWIVKKLQAFAKTEDVNKKEMWEEDRMLDCHSSEKNNL